MMGDQIEQQPRLKKVGAGGLESQPQVAKHIEIRPLVSCVVVSHIALQCQYSDIFGLFGLNTSSYF